MTAAVSELTTAPTPPPSSGKTGRVRRSPYVIGAVTISGPTVRMPQAQCEAWIDLLVGYAEQVTRTIGGRLPH